MSRIRVLAIVGGVAWWGLFLGMILMPSGSLVDPPLFSKEVYWPDLAMSGIFLAILCGMALALLMVIMGDSMEMVLPAITAAAISFCLLAVVSDLRKYIAQQDMLSVIRGVIFYASLFLFLLSSAIWRARSPAG